MKYLLALAAILVLVSTANAQETTTEDKREVRTEKDSAGSTVITSSTRTTRDEVTPRNDMIVLNPLKFFLFYNLSYIHKMDKHWAVGGGLQTPTIHGLSGIGANLEGRYYPGTHNLRGFYVAPNFSFNSLSAETYDYYYDGTSSQQTTRKESVTTTSIGALLGWQWFPGDDFAIGLGIGLDYYWFSGKSHDYTFSMSSVNGTVPAFRFDIGYGW
jgi:hypothetical protein